jgi:CRISPR-associated protein Csb2
VLRVRIRLPLGVYHARSVSDDAEWPPSPLRLIGALLAAAHERPGAEPETDRALLQRLCEAPAPLVLAPGSVAVGEPVHAKEAVRLRGATRWAPRNYITGPISPRNVGRERAEVSKAGVAVGDRPVAVEWPDLDLDERDLERLSILASEVTFLGTTRSPAILDVESGFGATAGAEARQDAWVPAPAGDDAGVEVTVRVPDAQAIAAFDRRHRARCATKERVEKAGMVPEAAIGTPVPYASRRHLRSGAVPFDPRWWGEMVVLEIAPESELMPKAPASYLLARAVRVMLLGAFGQAGTATEAPPILRARGAEPHCAIVPLPNVWGEHADGLIRGVALIPPNEAREPDVHAQMRQLELGLRRCTGAASGESASRYVHIPGAGKIWLKVPDAGSARLVSLRGGMYVRPAKRWVSVTPIVHSRWRKGGVDALLEQVSADCAHVGLPAPEGIEVLKSAGRRGGADAIVPSTAIPENWRGPLQGPMSHMRITFSEPVCGPVLIGRARHFGIGLCVPDDASDNQRAVL